MIKALLYIWQLPQNIVALIWTGILSIFYGKPEVVDYKGIKYHWFKRWNSGVSLGCYVIMGNYYRDRLDTINHEYGHTRQSIYLGPLYLLLIGLPSGLWNLMDRILTRTVKSWTWPKSYKIYYNMPWEKWADKLGGVDRHFD